MWLITRGLTAVILLWCAHHVGDKAQAGPLCCGARLLKHTLNPPCTSNTSVSGFQR